jgi:SPP1 gp7 family putative phage head morphogenesis protein
VEQGGGRVDAARDDLLLVLVNLTGAFNRGLPEAELEAELDQLAARMNDFQGGEFQKQLASMLGIPIAAPQAGIRSLLRAFIQDNIGLVRSLLGDDLRALEGLVGAGLRKGLRVEELRDQIQQRLQVSKSKAALLARDQTGKLFGELNRARQRSLGIEEYTWSTSNDERVRKGHKPLEGTRQRWDSPPVVDPRTGRREHPGGDYQCRCQAIPVLPEELLAAVDS